MTTFAAISLTTPAMLAGALLVALPILAHLMFRRAQRRVTFPTIRLLAEATATQSRLFNMRRLILLALRCLAVALIAWAFARPVWLDSRAAAAGGQGATVAIVLDVSASSGQTVGGVRAVDAIAAKAGRVLDGLTPGVDFATLVRAGAAPRVAYDEPIANLDALRDELAKLAPTQERADLSAALATAAAALAKQPGDRRLVVISDMQRTNWADLSVDAESLRAANIAVTVMAAGDDAAPANVSLTDPRIEPARPVSGRPATATVTVANYSSTDQTVHMRATVDGRPSGSRSLVVAAGSSVQAVFDVTLAGATRHRIAFDTDADALAVDNAAYLAVDAVEQATVLVVSDDDPGDPRGSSWFLARALAPRGDDRDGLAVRHVTGGGLTIAATAGAEAIVIGDVGRLGRAAIAALRDALASGRGVVWFADAGPVAANLEALAEATGDAGGDAGVVPWRPTVRREVRPGEAPLAFDGGAFHSGPLDGFDDAAQLALRSVPIYRAHHVDRVNADAFHVLRYADGGDGGAGTPAMSVTGYRDGRLVVANFGVSAAASDLGKRGPFVAMLHALVDYVRPAGEGRGRLAVGSPLVLSVAADPSVTYTATGPDDAPPPLRVTTGDAGTSVTIARATAAGFYEVRRNGEPIRLFAVNVDGREGDLARTDPALLRERFGQAGGSVDVVDASGRAVVTTGGRPLWHWFVLAAMAAMAAELAMLCVWRR